MAKFKPGQSGNPAGKKPGTKSKSVAQVRKIIAAALTEYLDKDMLLSDLKELDSKDRLSAIDRLLKHYIPPPVDEILRLSDADFERLVNEITKRTKQ
jgi:hypothetical protein